MTLTLKETIGQINEMAKENFEVAEWMLDVVNNTAGTSFGWLNGRVVMFDNPDASTAEKYMHCRDAYETLAKDEEVAIVPAVYDIAYELRADGGFICWIEVIKTEQCRKQRKEE